MNERSTGVMTVREENKSMSISVVRAPATARLALLGGAIMLATVLTHAVVFMLGGGVERATARLVGMAVGATRFGSLGTACVSATAPKRGCSCDRALLCIGRFDRRRGLPRPE